MPEQIKAGAIWREPTKRDTPPYLGSKKRLYPHNFSHQKSRKKSPWQIGKNFGKNLWENVSGEEKAPNLVERGRSAKIRKISLRMQR